MKLLLDTNAYSALMRGDPAVAAKAREASGICMSVIVVGELVFGFRRGTRLAENYRELTRFLANPYVELLPIVRNTADRFGAIAATLREKGTPIPTNDIWLAAQALDHTIPLLSDDGHFTAIDGLLWMRFND